MRRLLLPLLAAAVLAAPLAPAFGQGNTASVPRITLVELKKLQAEGRVTVVDVRDPESFRAGHIPGALSIPLEQFVEGDARAALAKLKNAKKPIVTYCS